MEQAITRGTQKGFKTALSGPHRPQMPFVKPNSKKDTGAFERAPEIIDVELGGVDLNKFNAAGATYRGGMQPTAPSLGDDLDGFDQEALIAHGNSLFTDHSKKATGKSSKTAGFNGLKRKVQA